MPLIGSQVPTIAIEHVYVWNNTSVIVDEVLSHRLGLVPLNVDPRLLEFRPSLYLVSPSTHFTATHLILQADPGVPDVPTDQNTVVFRLNVKCERNPGVRKDETDPEKLYKNSNGLNRLFLNL